MEETRKSIVIADKPVKDILMALAFEAMSYDEMKISYTDNHAPKAEYVLKILRKGFGWVEVSRQRVATENKKCIFEGQKGACENKEVSREINSCLPANARFTMRSLSQYMRAKGIHKTIKLVKKKNGRTRQYIFYSVQIPDQSTSEKVDKTIRRTKDKNNKQSKKRSTIHKQRNKTITR